MKNSEKTAEKSEISTSSKIDFRAFFYAGFAISFDIFISTCRMTLIFLLTYSLMLEEYFWYIQRVLKVIFEDSGALWSEKLGKKSAEMRNL